ncbi:response regulator transcription factor [Paenibacillus chibensis]|uniref:Response regulator transcription factor n=1 Tax=Paenibacillus chibensis TaxID=59846 RepID=A0ABU6PT80_9BACL|nr:response regulator transcription factor [Paenibacillus chibensis]
MEVQLLKALHDEGYAIKVVSTEHEALRSINRDELDMLLLERSSHSTNSLHKMMKAFLREQGNRPFPIILFVDEASPSAVVEGLGAGANDVVPITVGKEELLARIRNLLGIFRIENERSSQQVVIDDLIIDPGSRKVRRGDTELSLTVKEFDLLLYLARHANRVCTREEILKKVWDYDFHMGTNVVDVYIRHLRTKMDKGFSNKLIQSVRGVGYIIKEGE